jgi:hypothetical protein
MWKDVAIVAGAAALGEYASRTWGGSIEKFAVDKKIPTPVAHAVVVGGFAGAGYFLIKAIV